VGFSRSVPVLWPAGATSVSHPTIWKSRSWRRATAAATGPKVLGEFEKLPWPICAEMGVNRLLIAMLANLALTDWRLARRMATRRLAVLRLRVNRVRWARSVKIAIIVSH
jgi:hypothetical protein